MFGAPKTKDLTPQQVKAALDAREILLIDVREPAEFAAEKIEGALNVPLSTFNPAALPHAGGKTIVLQCAGGKRSGKALDQCAAAQSVIDTHLAGGIGAWKDAGMPVVGS